MLIDTTLREGEQLFGARYKFETKRALLSGLFTVGVEEAELGWVGREGLAELCAWAADQAPRTNVSCWSRCRADDVRSAREAGFTRINMGLPSSDAHREKRLGLDRAGVLALLQDALTAALDAGFEYVSIGMEDVTRADRDFALELAGLAEEAGTARIRLSDTVGLLSPLETAELVGAFRAELSCDLALHAHNDFGMATANAVTALAAGCDYVDASLLGLGERSGIAALEELVAYSALRLGEDRYTCSGLRDLCALAAEAAGIDIARIKPVAGRDIFACETGLHLAGIAKDPGLFEAYDPEELGGERRLERGWKSGKKEDARTHKSQE